jgi:hypothetical protein
MEMAMVFPIFPYEKDVNEKPELILPFADTGYC